MSKLYQIVIEVPDNFVPEKMEIIATEYPNSRIVAEGYVMDHFRDDSELTEVSMEQEEE